MSKEEKEKEQIHCTLCFLSKEKNKKTKFHLYDTGDFSSPGDKHVCQSCLSWIHSMRKKAGEQAKHPEKDVFKDMNWWWAPSKEGESAVEIVLK